MNHNMQISLSNHFNIVVGNPSANVVVKEHDGFVLMGDVSNHLFDKLISEHKSTVLSEDALYKTFYKSFKTVLNTSEACRIQDQIASYASTYGTEFSGTMFVPNETYGTVVSGKPVLPVRLVRVVSQDQAKQIVSDFVNTGIALKQETMCDLFDILCELDYDFQECPVKNKEMTILVATKLGIMPEKPEDFLRFMLYQATRSTLLIKNSYTVDCISKSQSARDALRNYVDQFGTEPLAQIFNRFKPLFLALKANIKIVNLPASNSSEGQNSSMRTIINKIAKQSKRLHKPMVQNPINTVTSRPLMDSDAHWLKNATTLALLRALDSIELAQYSPELQMYPIRNGRVYVKETDATTRNFGVMTLNRTMLMSELKSRVNGQGKIVYIPDFIDYAVPASEKSFVGNVPVLTRVSNPDSITIGIHWRNEWGARDIDLSSLNTNGVKVGWNSSWQDDSRIIYSGDVTDATDGATEFLQFKKGCDPQAIYANIYSGSQSTEYDLIVATQGHAGKFPDDACVKPEDVLMSTRLTSTRKESILGFITSNDMGEFTFIFTNYGFGTSAVSQHNEKSSNLLGAVDIKNAIRLSLVDVLVELGYTIVRTRDSDTPVDVDLSLTALTRDSIIKLFG